MPNRSFFIYTLYSFLLLLGLEVLAGGLFAQSYTFSSLPGGDNLPVAYYNEFLQDRQGYMWMATSRGVFRYDGHSFTEYHYIPGDSTSLPAEQAITLGEDEEGFIWIGTETRGLVRYDPEKDLFHTFSNDVNDPSSIPGNAIKKVYPDQNGKIWVGLGNSGLAAYDKAADAFIHIDFGIPEGEPFNVFDITKDLNEEGRLWVGTTNGLYRYNISSGEIEHFPAPVFQYPGKAKEVLGRGRGPYSKFGTILHDRPGEVWAGNDYGELLHLDLATGEWSYKVMERWVIADIDRKSENELWVCTNYKGLKIYNTDDKSISVIEADLDFPSALPTSLVGEMYQDRAGNYWVGMGGEFRILDPRLQIFSIETLMEDATTGSEWVSAMFEDTTDNLIYFAAFHSGAPRTWNRETGEVKSLAYTSALDQARGWSYITQIKQDPQGRLWFASRAGPLVMDKEVGEIKTFEETFGKEFPAPDKVIYDIVFDKKGNAWVVSRSSGLIKIDLESGETTHFPPDLNEPNGLPTDAWSGGLYIDQSEKLWIASRKGMSQMFMEKESFMDLSDIDETGFLREVYFRTALEDNEGRVWISSTGNGIVIIDYNKPKGQQIIQLSINDGLPANDIWDIAKDKNGIIWMVNGDGLARINPKTLDIQSFHQSDGLYSKTYNNQPLLLLSSGEMLLGEMARVTIFDPEDILEDENPPAIVFNDIKVFDWSPDLEKSLNFVDELSFPYDENFLTISFSALSFTRPEKTQYAYKLEGLEKNRNFVDNQNFARYTDLSPGDYTFHVWAANSYGIWNETGRSLRIEIRPPFWQTWWAYLIYTLLGLVFLYLLREEVVRRERLKNELTLRQLEATKFQEIDQLKSRFFANISHEFRTPLTLILGPIQSMKEDLGEQGILKLSGEKADNLLGSMHRNARRLLTLINQLLDLSQMDSGNMKLAPVPMKVNDFLKPLVYSFQSLGDLKEIRFRTSFPEEEIVALMDSDKLEKIITNLLGNAFKFTGEGGEVSFDAQWEPGSGESGRLELRIGDSGPGIPEEQVKQIFDRFYQVDGRLSRAWEGSGIGLSLVKELVDLHKGDIGVQSKEGVGTVFTLSLPLTTSQLPVEQIENDHQKKSLPADAEYLPAKPEDNLMGQPAYLDLMDERPLLLVVEDNPEVRAFICSNLKAGYRIEEAANGHEGVEQAIRHVPDLIISDVMMPGMDGIEFCGKVKTDERTSHIPVILLTARASHDSKLEGLETGADAYLTKPFDIAELQLRVRKLIEQRGELRRKFGDGVEPPVHEAEGLSAIDRRFLQRCINFVEQQLGNPEFSVEVLSEHLEMSRAQTYRKLKALTGQTPTEFIRALRLKEAARLLAESDDNVSQVAYQVGFSNLSYFARAFKDQHGLLPKEYASRHKKSASS